MQIKIEHEEGYVLVAVSGMIDETAGGLFREYVHPIVGQKGARAVIDLSGSDRINSAGIGQIVLLAAHANSCGSRIILAACTPFVAIVMGRCKLDRFFEMAESVPEAIKRFLDTES